MALVIQESLDSPRRPGEWLAWAFVSSLQLAWRTPGLRIRAGRAVADFAFHRKESRGLHQQMDCPGKDKSKILVETLILPEGELMRSRSTAHILL
jgi:succinate dehydrogenase/fumarate reductase flavoprotein subunit